MPQLPSERGPAPVGVKTLEVRDDARAGRTLPVEVWYPADESHRGQDLDAATLDRFEIAAGLPDCDRRQRGRSFTRVQSGHLARQDPWLVQVQVAPASPSQAAWVESRAAVWILSRCRR